jgi:biotin carboxyl carrier protein
MELSQLAPLAIASTLAVFWNQPAPTSAPVPPATPAAVTASEDDATSSRRHKITCNVTSIEDVKVQEKDRVIEGQTLCDRTEARAELEAKKQQLELTLQQQPISVSPSMPLQLPPADYSVEEMAIKSAQAELARLEMLPSPQFMHKDPWFQEAVEPQKWQENLDRQQQIAEARYRVGEAMAMLNQAKARRQQEELTFLQQQQLSQQQLLLDQQRSQQQSSYQKAQLLNDLQELEEKIEQITAIKSPYAGSVRRVKILGQNDRTIQVEISLIANSPTDE